MPEGPRKFHFSFERSGLTRFGGLSLFQSFCKSLGLRHFLQLYVRWPDYHHRGYPPAALFLAHLFAIVAGIGRIENAQSLIHNGLIPPLLGLPEFPHRDTLRNFLWRFGSQELRSLVAAHDRLRQELFLRRYHSADHLRFSRRHGGGLHSQETPWPSFLRADYLQRRAPRFELGHGTESRQYPRLLGSLGFSESGLGQTPFLGGVHAHAGTTRWSFLRQKHCRVPRRKAAGLRRCRPHVPTVENPHGRSSIPGVRSRMGSRSVLLHSPQVEARASVCGRAPAHNFGNRTDPAAALHFQAVHLPSSARHQSGADSTNRLAFLLRPRISGAFAAGIQGLLCHGQDPNPQLLGQCDLHGDAAVGLRLGVGFPVPLLARRSSTLEHLHPAPRALVAARRMGQTGQSQPFDAPSEVSSSGVVPQDSARSLESQALDLSQFATRLTARSLIGE